jgi:hypothetical protein
MKYLDEESAEREAENEVYHTFNLRRDLLWDRVTGVRYLCDGINFELNIRGRNIKSGGSVRRMVPWKDSRKCPTGSLSHYLGNFVVKKSPEERA